MIQDDVQKSSDIECSKKCLVCRHSLHVHSFCPLHLLAQGFPGPSILHLKLFCLSAAPPVSLPYAHTPALELNDPTSIASSCVGRSRMHSAYSFLTKGRSMGGYRCHLM